MKIVIENVRNEDPAVLYTIGEALKKLGSRNPKMVKTDDTAIAVLDETESYCPDEPVTYETLPPNVAEDFEAAIETHDKSYAEAATETVCDVPKEKLPPNMKVYPTLEEAEQASQELSETVTEPDFNGADAYAPTAPELDLDGLPWDERIHASTKTTIKNGTWKRKRGISEDLYNSVVAELRADYPEQTPAEPVKELDGTVKPDPNDVFNGNVGAVGTPPPAIPKELEYTAVSLLAELANAVQNGVCTQAEVDTVIPIVLNENGLTSISEIMGRPELVLPIRERLNDLLGPRV